MGIRVALGAVPSQVRRAVQHDALLTVVIGAGVGLVGSILLSRAFRSFLFEVSPIHVPTLVGALLLLGGSAWAASWVPARRGTRVDLVSILREE